MNTRATRILVVEDQTLVATDLAARLRRHLYEVVGTTPSGAEAIEATAALAPDLVLMDIGLRGDMDGITAAGQIRDRFDVPVIFLTGHADAITIERAKATSPVGYLIKPFTDQELRATIEIGLYMHDTERALAEERALRLAAEESRLLLDSVEDYAIFRLDPDACVASWHLGASRIQGYSAGEALGVHHSRFFVPDDVADGLPERLLLTARERGRAEFEGWLLRGDGTRYWGHATVTSLRDELEHLRGYAVVVRDMTERREHERALKESEERFRMTVVNAPVPMMLHAEDGEILAVSDAVLELTGYSRRDLGRLEDWLRLAYRERADEIRALVEAALRNGRPEPFELPVRTASGDSRQWLFSLSAPLVLADGRRAIVVVAVDVTEQRKAEQALREAHGQKDEFIAMLGHELRNPLAAIRSATELLDQATTDELHRARTRAVLERQTAHMAKLIDGLLDVSRIVSGKIAIDTEPVDLGEVIDDVLQDRAAQIESRGLELHSEHSDTPLWVRGDRVRLEQVVDNLLANAIRFTEGSGTITVRARAQGPEAVLEFEDTGIGIDRDLLPYVFEPFRQATQTLARASGGLGLGLALVRGVVELHGGSVVARSGGRGKGSQFTVRLPLTTAPEQPRPIEQPRTQPARMLVVEDNEDAADMLCDVLRFAGHEVAVAYDGESATRIAKDFAPEVVLCDIGLPGAMDGYDVARALRADRDVSGALLVAVTGYGRPEDVSRANEAGFDAHLTKPVDGNEIEALLAGYRMHPPAAAGA